MMNNKNPSESASGVKIERTATLCLLFLVLAQLVILHLWARYLLTEVSVMPDSELPLVIIWFFTFFAKPLLPLLLALSLEIWSYFVAFRKPISSAHVAVHLVFLTAFALLLHAWTLGTFLIGYRELVGV